MNARPTFKVVASSLLLSLALIAGGCSPFTNLIATPTVVYIQDDAASAFERSVPPDQRVPEMRIIYATDRSVDRVTDEGPQYGSKRSHTLAFGTAAVSLNPAVTWTQLVHASSARDRAQTYHLDTGEVRPMGRIAIALDDMTVSHGKFVLTDESKSELQESRGRLHALLHDQLAGAEHKSVFLFVHGFNNSFDDATYRVAQLWHFAGRPGAPVCYTWPAGVGGLFGYFRDYESGAFTVFHLKRFILDLASCPEVEHVNIIAHSRGADVTVAALRELHLQFKGGGRSTRDELKLDNLVLAAPDLDQDVFMQRLAIEDLATATERLTIYLSASDLPLRVSNWLFGGSNRLGTMTSDNLDPRYRDVLSRMSNINFIECDVTSFSTSHDYVFAHPAVVSDLILLLRDNRAPGAEHGRPLLPIDSGAWRIRNDYLLTTDSEGGRTAR